MMHIANLFAKTIDGAGREHFSAASRKTNPATSRTAARRHEAKGKAASNRHACLEALCAASGSTAAEIAQLAGLERHEASRRLPELRRAGLVKNGPARVCRVTGNLSLTWTTGQDGKL
jgi:CRP-like cAMP-binding protein